MAERKGVVEGLEVFEKGPGKAKVGGRVVRFWAKEYQSDVDSDVLELLRKAQSEGLEATVTGEESKRDGPQGKYTQFMAQSVTLGGSATTAHPANGQPSNGSKFTGRDPGLNDYWTAQRHAFSSAVEILGPGKKVDEYDPLAQEIFIRLFQRAENSHGSPAQGEQESAKAEGDGW